MCSEAPVPSQWVDTLQTKRQTQVSPLHRAGRSTHRVHLREDLVDALLGGVLVLGQVEHVAHHAVDGVHDVHHLLLRDEAVVVQVVQVERPC